MDIYQLIALCAILIGMTSVVSFEIYNIYKEHKSKKV